MSDRGPMLSAILALPNETSNNNGSVSGDLHTLTDRLSKEIKKVRWTATMPALVEKLTALLDIPLPRVMVAAWEKSDEIRRTLDESKQSPEDEFSVDLTEHTFSAEFRPEIEVQVAKLPAKILQFVIQISLTLRGIELKMRKGEIVEIRTGMCDVGGKLLYDDLVLAERPLSSFELPKVIDPLA
jgi:hypothetical protein